MTYATSVPKNQPVSLAIGSSDPDDREDSRSVVAVFIEQDYDRRATHPIGLGKVLLRPIGAETFPEVEPQRNMAVRIKPMRPILGFIN